MRDEKRCRWCGATYGAGGYRAHTGGDQQQERIEALENEVRDELAGRLVSLEGRLAELEFGRFQGLESRLDALEWRTR